ncbi:hypothetical protein BN2127_JRS4_04848 [Bacillus cereus]|nr:hypothetical protein BN2127_JRS4_04848 [Bacillus cereus]
MIMNHKRTSIIEKGLMYFVKVKNINELMFKSGYGIVAYISKPNTTLLSQMREISKSIKGWLVEYKRGCREIETANNFIPS